MKKKTTYTMCTSVLSFIPQRNEKYQHSILKLLNKGVILLTDISTRLWCGAECHLPSTKRVLMENTDFQLRAIIPLCVTAKQLVPVFYKDKRYKGKR